MKNFLKLYFLALPIFLAFDASWIGVIASSFYRNTIGQYFSASPNFYAAAAFYILYVTSLLYFAVLPALRERNFAQAMIRAAALGFTSFMTYDLTNEATLANWPVITTIVDISWGTLNSAVTCGLTYILATKLYNIEETRSI